MTNVKAQAAGRDWPAQTSCASIPAALPTCYASIQAAVNAASDGSTIRVAEGAYYETVMLTKSLTLEGGWNAGFQRKLTRTSSRPPSPSRLAWARPRHSSFVLPVPWPARVPRPLGLSLGTKPEDRSCTGGPYCATGQTARAQDCSPHAHCCSHTTGPLVRGRLAPLSPVGMRERTKSVRRGSGRCRLCEGCCQV